MVDFSDYFWGEKNNGFDVLYHNMKFGLVASKELAEFFRESSNIEEYNSKVLGKLAKQAGSGCVQGTFAPVWQAVRSTAEKLSQLHLQMVHKISELVKEVTKYADELHKKHKTVKEEECGTLEVAQAIQSTSVTLQKAKDIYVQRGQELDKLKKDNASAKELEKAELKLKKAQEEYKTLVDKYSSVKEDFEKKMSLACQHFQKIEEAHLKQMKEFLNTYSELVENNHDLIGREYIEFKRQCVEMTVEKLLEQFVLSKYTGLEKPGCIEFEEVPVSVAAAGVEEAKPSTAPGVKREGFLRSRRDKRKEKKAKKKKDGSQDSTSCKDEKSDVEEKEDTHKSKTPTPEVDDEGYCIRPKLDPWDHDKGSFYSSSDTDSEDEREQKIHVEIKPLGNGTGPISASVDELRATVENISLSPLGTIPGRRGSNAEDHTMKRSQSVSQQIGGGKLNNDLVGLTLFQSPIGSSASTPTTSHPYAPLQSPTLTSASSPAPVTTSRYSDLQDLFQEVGVIQPAGVGVERTQRQTPTPTSGIAIPRPPSRRDDITSSGTLSRNNAGRNSPALRSSPGPSNIARADSVSSLEFRAAGVPVGLSRGPSPLTLGMSDTIPLAVAFHEMIHSYFHGTDEKKCQVKLSGDMMLSFPAGIVNLLTNNPNPAQLIFKLTNSSRLTKVFPNKQLIIWDYDEPCLETLPPWTTFKFNMSALTALLKRQAEKNPTASYFNVDILKYQVKPFIGAASCPFQLVAYWKCEKNQTDIRVDYMYNKKAMGSPSPLLNLSVSVPVDGDVKAMNAEPQAEWDKNNNCAVWRFTELSDLTENGPIGSLRARFEVAKGPSSIGIIAVQFNCEGTTLSGVDLELQGPGFRVSLVKKRFVSGKYICHGSNNKNRCIEGSENNDENNENHSSSSSDS
ncbi:F-BAR domain only protein 2-like isoform X2 [Macrosteles quadrilineatus]|uniref:F-BAR domain only protein 2-like isoform X2 n=1 Tax=Macrosteles quadrilineatus TaxID=74068 RepID=UPI0023E20378|nr:F-BAR domain only protein 2-like isoform X2 [Macrosteles quadrilineatus]XP_054280226.1 F-BAR domain only protein 2-like isoform X2 [Macrosteles quadrilineatus]